MTLLFHRHWKVHAMQRAASSSARRRNTDWRRAPCAWATSAPPPALRNSAQKHRFPCGSRCLGFWGFHAAGTNHRTPTLALDCCVVAAGFTSVLGRAPIFYDNQLVEVFVSKEPNKEVELDWKVMCSNCYVSHNVLANQYSKIFVHIWHYFVKVFPWLQNVNYNITLATTDKQSFYHINTTYIIFS